MYDYRGKGTYLNGFLNYIQKHHPEIEIKFYGDLNVHLKAIRLRKEPNKPVSKSTEKNVYYIQTNYNWEEDVVTYFNSLKSV